MAYDSDVEDTPLLAADSDTTYDGKHRRKDLNARIPWAALSALWLVNVVPGLAFEIILPFVNAMLMENGVAHNPEEVGWYSGVTESLFAVVQILTVVPFSYISDVIGRKPMIVLGNIGVALSTSCFGVSKTFKGMLLSRALSGALGGSWAAIRVMLAEMVPKHFHATAFAGIAMSYRVGQIIGLPLGGWLAHPERHLGFTGQFWRTYPFALPCFVGAAFAVLTAIYGLIALRETLKNPWRPTLRRRKEYDSRSSTPKNAIDELPKPKRAVTLSEAMNPKAVHVLISNFLTAFFAECLFALIPLFCFTPRRSAGLGLSEAQIGTHMSIRAVVHILLMIPFPIFQRRFGTVGVYNLVTPLWPITIALFPVCGHLAKRYDDPNHPLVWAAVLLLYVVWSLASLGWACMSILINDATPSPEALARLNAIAQLSIVIPQALAPASGTALFAFSLRTGFLNGNLIWVLLFAFSCLFALHAWWFIRDEPEAESES
ncbi:MFS general substrate transporter [Auriculariales sp. MPI-PUGE-AT-0066]|nr:MFS general substrate transporter [Auriculariales sp. MPI-PUGE-AT-0066]